jgi:APA family basic amino acid/polyamine antiporter
MSYHYWYFLHLALAKTEYMNQKAKGLTLFALTMIAIGSTIGSGIFKTPADIASAVPNPTEMMGLWILGGVISLIGALVFAELGARFPQSGGLFTYLHKSYGPLPAFLYGWSLLTVISSGTIAALILVFADYAQYFLHFSDGMKPLVAALAIVVLTLFNTFGIKSSEWFANISTILKIVGIYGLLIAALFLGDRAIFGESTAAVINAASDGGPNYASAFVGVLWSYTGWHYASFVAGDAINPKRNVPLAMILGTAAVTLTYVLCNMGYMAVLDMETIQSSKTLAADALEKVIPNSGIFVSALIAISVFGCAGLYILATPRIIHQMSNEGLFFKTFSKKSEKFGVPVNAILLQSIWAIVLIFVWGRFEALYTYVTTTEWLFLLMACFGIFIVRSKMKNEEVSFKTPLYPILPIIFCVVIGWFIYMNAFSDKPEAYFGLLIIPLGVIFYFLYKAFGRK